MKFNFYQGINRFLIPRLFTLANPPKLFDQVQAVLRSKCYSIRTEQAYLDWIKRFIRHFCKRYPNEMGAYKVESFFGRRGQA